MISEEQLNEWGNELCFYGPENVRPQVLALIAEVRKLRKVAVEAKKVAYHNDVEQAVAWDLFRAIEEWESPE